MKVKRESSSNVKTKRTKRESAVIAYHEAGHVVVGWALGVEIEKVTIVYNDSTHPHVYCGDHKVSEERDLAMIIIMLAGQEAQSRFDSASRDGSRRDHENIKHLVRNIRLRRNPPFTKFPAGLSDDECKKLIDEFFSYGDEPLDSDDVDLDSCKRECRRLVREYWVLIEKLAKALLERRTLTGEEIEAVLSR